MISIYADNDLLWFQGTDDESYLIYNVNWDEAVNKAGSLSFNLPVTHRLYDSLKKLKTTIRIKEDGVEIWKGRIIHDEKDFYKTKNVYCEGQLSFLMDSVIRPYDTTVSVEQTFTNYLTQHNSQVGSDRQILVGDCTVTDPNNYLPRSSTLYPKTLNEITEKLLNSLGGYLIPRLSGGVWYIDYKTSYDHISDQVIEFGKNLLDITEHITAENVFTVLIPLGKKEESSEGTEGQRLTIKDVNDGKDYLENQTAINLFGRITATKEWDDVTEAANLKTKGQEVLNQNIEMSVTLSIKAVDLHYMGVNTGRILIGDMVRVVSVPHGLNTYFLCSEIKHDLENPANDTYTLGVGFTALSDKQVEDQKKATHAFNVAESASSSISNITVDIGSNYVAKTEFTAYQNLTNNNFTAINGQLIDAMHYKGSVSDSENLPSSGNVVGDVYFIADEGSHYVYDGTSWKKLSEDLSGYATKTDLDNYALLTDLSYLDARVTALEGNV